jgi:hypothetical protein
VLDPRGVGEGLPAEVLRELLEQLGKALLGISL